MAIFFRAQTSVVFALALMIGLIARADEAKAEKPAITAPELKASIPLPEAVIASAAVDVPTKDIFLREDGGAGLRIDDTVTLVATVVDGEKIRQWIILLKVQDFKPEEKDKYYSAPWTLYTNLGGKIEFPKSPLGSLAIRVLGPYSPGKGSKGAKNIWSGAIINPQFLALGFNGTSTLMQRLLTLREPVSLAMNATPFPEERIAEGRRQNATFGITAEEERAFAGFMPAMLSFFQIASQTTGLRDIVFEMIDVPWMSLIAHGGKIDDVNFAITPPFDELAPAKWGLPATMKVGSLAMQLELFKKPALLCNMAVTLPAPPLLNCAGIVGFTACRPNGKGPRLTVNVVAARPVPAPRLAPVAGANNP